MTFCIISDFRMFVLQNHVKFMSASNETNAAILHGPTLSLKSRNLSYIEYINSNSAHGDRNVKKETFKRVVEPIESPQNIWSMAQTWYQESSRRHFPEALSMPSCRGGLSEIPGAMFPKKQDALTRK